MSFANPGYLFLLLLLIPIIGWYIWKLRNAKASVQLSSTATLQRQPKSLRTYLIHVPFALRVAVVVLLSIALARPQLSNRWQSESTEGIDIMMALDVSGTMLGEDFKPNRLEAAKAVATDFVIARPNDQIGLVVFAGESFTQCLFVELRIHSTILSSVGCLDRYTYLSVTPHSNGIDTYAIGLCNLGSRLWVYLTTVVTTIRQQDDDL